MERRKKCTEKGFRELDWGVNPHSKGDPFSSSEKFFVLKNIAKARRNKLMRKNKKKKVIRISTKKELLRKQENKLHEKEI